MQVFFGVTKLFQSSDGNLRRMVYLFIKQVAEQTDPGSVIIVVQSLVKDMVNEVPLYKSNAIRVLSKIVDASMLVQVERYYKQAIVDKDEGVASAALASSLYLLDKPGCSDIISRWTSEVQTVLASARSDSVQFLALALLRSVKRTDRLAVSKVVQTLIRAGVRSPLALCLLIRYTTQLLLAPDAPSEVQASALSFLEGCLRHKSEMVIFEAARALIAIPATSPVAANRDIGNSITVLQMFLSSSKPTLRYAAVRTLSTLAATYPGPVSKCNEELEAAINDTNRTIGTLATTTLLRTASETAVDRLMKQISTFMAEVGSDELKVVVVKAIHDLALRTPAKHRAIMSFLATALRDEGGYDFKKALLDALLDIMEAIPEAKTDGLFHLCEFIEDCEFTALATRVLHLLGKEGPAMPAPQPASFIRFIYNRVILENPAVRASAVTALAKFATQCEDLRPQIIPLLQRCTDDDDDEVRDRAATYLRMLGAEAAPPSVEEAILRSLTPGSTDLVAMDRGVARELTSGLLPMPIHALSRALTLYQNRPTPGAFSFAALPHTESEAIPAEGGYGYNSEVRAAEATSKARTGLVAVPTPPHDVGSGAGASSGHAGGSGASAAAATDAAVEALYKIKEFASFGALFRSSQAVELTERELEYLVSVQKHVFADHVVSVLLQRRARAPRPPSLTARRCVSFSRPPHPPLPPAQVLAVTVSNTVPDVQLERVHVQMSIQDADCGFKPILSLACPKVKHGAPSTAYVALQREAGSVGPAAFGCTLRFLVRDIDHDSGAAVGDATPEEYPVNDIEVTPADFVARTPVADFRAAWEAMGNENEVQESFGLTFKTVSDAVAAIIDTLGLAPCEGTGSVKAGTPKHTAYLAGAFLGGIKVLARMQVSLEGENSCTLRIALRAEDGGVAEALMSLIR